MNTKYPINGRVATLNDLVHEYGAFSSWPQTSDYNLFDTKKLVSQPFQNLVFKDALDANDQSTKDALQSSSKLNDVFYGENKLDIFKDNPNLTENV